MIFINNSLKKIVLSKILTIFVTLITIYLRGCEVHYKRVGLFLFKVIPKNILKAVYTPVNTL